MNIEFINLTKENLADEHLCCIIRSKKSHQVMRQSADGLLTALMKVMSLEN